MEAVAGALHEVFCVPRALRNVLLQVHAPHRLMGKPDSPDPSRTTNVSLFVLAGRSLDAKRRLYAAIVERLAALGIPPACVLIKLHELPAQDVGVRGGQAACDVELGYSTQV